MKYKRQMAIIGSVISCLRRPSCWWRTLLCDCNELRGLRDNTSFALFPFLLLCWVFRQPALSVFPPMTSFLPEGNVSWNVQALGLFWCDTGCGAPLTEQQSSTLIGHLHRLSSPASVCSAASPNLAFKKVEKKKPCPIWTTNTLASNLYIFS